MREFYGTIVQVLKDDDMHIVTVYVASRFRPHTSGKRLLKLFTDKWNHGSRRFAVRPLDDVPGRPPGAITSAAKAATIAHLDHGRPMAVRDPFVGTVRGGTTDTRRTGTYPCRWDEYEAAMARFVVADCDAGIACGDVYPKRVQWALVVRRAELLGDPKPKRPKREPKARSTIAKRRRR